MLWYVNINIIKIKTKKSIVIVIQYDKSFTLLLRFFHLELKNKLEWLRNAQRTAPKYHSWYTRIIPIKKYVSVILII